MTCNGSYQNDRICELCEISNKEEFKICKKQNIDKNKLKNKLANIYDKCPHRYEGGYGWDTYDECRKTNIHCNCHPTIECGK